MTAPDTPWIRRSLTAITALAVTGFILWLGCQQGSGREDYSFTYLAGLVGALTGWVTGIFLSPYSQGEARQFSDYGKALSAFISGYLLSKCDRFLDNVDVNAPLGPKLLQYRILYFFACFFLAMIIAFLLRKYAPFGLGRPDADTNVPGAIKPDVPVAPAPTLALH